MNNPVVKMLKYELKSNSIIWIFNLVISATLLTFIYVQMNGHNLIISKVLFPIFALLSGIFTINAYQESTKSQSMQMYHLIPVSRNMKFLSKQLITFAAFPIILIILTFIFTLLMNSFGQHSIVYSGPESDEHSFFFLLTVWVLFHSVATFFAIVFKRNKVLYSILSIFVFKLALGILLLTTFVLLGIKSTDSMNLFSLTSFPFEMSEIAVVFIVAFLYGISYHLFFRRQL